MTGPRALFVGLATVDVVQRVDRAPGRDEKVVSTRADVAAGGPATNAAVTFAALGGRATLLTVIGGGPLAAVIHGDLEECGVEVVDADTTGRSRPPLSAVTVVESTGERSVVSRNATGVEVEVPAVLQALVQRADVVLVDGHHPRLALAAAQTAHDTGVPVVLDAGSWKPVLTDLLPLATMVICSADFRLPDGSSPGAEQLDQGPVLVAASAGAEPVHWWTRDAAGTVPVPTVRARDSLGAGDVLHGAYSFAVADGVDPVEALHHAVAVASLKVSHVGPRSWTKDPQLRTVTAGGSR